MTAPSDCHHVLHAAAEWRHDGPTSLRPKTFGTLPNNLLAQAGHVGARSMLMMALDELMNQPAPAGCRIMRAPFHCGLSDLRLFHGMLPSG
jgi:hypothetical protein